MLTDVGQLLSIDAEHGGVHQRVEVGDDAAVHSIARSCAADAGDDKVLDAGQG